MKYDDYDSMQRLAKENLPFGIYWRWGWLSYFEKSALLIAPTIVALTILSMIYNWIHLYLIIGIVAWGSLGAIVIGVCLMSIHILMGWSKLTDKDFE